MNLATFYPAVFIFMSCATGAPMVDPEDAASDTACDRGYELFWFKHDWRNSIGCDRLSSPSKGYQTASGNGQSMFLKARLFGYSR